MKWLRRLGIFCGVVYLLIAGLLYFKQEALLFHPRARNADYSYGNYPEEWLALPDGTRLHALHLRSAAQKGVILYFHGNVGDNGRSLYQVGGLRELGYDLYLVDYPGFGKSEGATDRTDDLTTNFQTVYDRLLTEYPEDRIIVLGYSLGTGPASYLAARNQPRATVLVAPYTSLAAMKDRWFWMFPDFLLKYDVDNARNLSRARGPVYVLHGTADELIPVAMGRELAALGDNIKLVELPNVGHRGAILSRQVPEVVRYVAKGDFSASPPAPLPGRGEQIMD